MNSRSNQSAIEWDEHSFVIKWKGGSSNTQNTTITLFRVTQTGDFFGEYTNYTMRFIRELSGNVSSRDIERIYGLIKEIVLLNPDPNSTRPGACWAGLLATGDWMKHDVVMRYYRDDEITLSAGLKFTSIIEVIRPYVKDSLRIAMSKFPYHENGSS